MDYWWHGSVIELSLLVLQSPSFSVAACESTTGETLQNKTSTLATYQCWASATHKGTKSTTKMNLPLSYCEFLTVERTSHSVLTSAAFTLFRFRGTFLTNKIDLCRLCWKSKQQGSVLNSGLSWFWRLVITLRVSSDSRIASTLNMPITCDCSEHCCFNKYYTIRNQERTLTSDRLRGPF